MVWACAAAVSHVGAELFARHTTPALWISRGLVILLASISAILLICAMFRRLIAQRRLVQGLCVFCGYKLENLPQCPECGRSTDPLLARNSSCAFTHEKHAVRWLIGFSAFAILILAVTPVPYVFSSGALGGGVSRDVPAPPTSPKVRVWYRLERMIWASPAFVWWDTASQKKTWRALRIDVNEDGHAVAHVWYQGSSRRFAFSRPASNSAYTTSREEVAKHLPMQWSTAFQTTVISAITLVPLDPYDDDYGVIHPARGTWIGISLIGVAAGCCATRSTRQGRRAK